MKMNKNTPLQLIGRGMVFGFCLGILTFDIYMTPIVINKIAKVIALVIEFIN
jgi:hypothetical protein